MASATADEDSFPQKLWKMVEDENYDEIIWWNEGGDGFLICEEKEKFLTSKILPVNKFKHNNYSSFERQLLNYGFHKRKNRRKTKAYHHDGGYFNRNHPELSKITKRKKKGTDSGVSSEADQQTEIIPEIIPEITPDWGPLQGGTLFKLNNLQVNVSVPHLIVNFGTKEVGVVRGFSGKSWLGETPPGDWQGQTVMVIIKKPDGSKLGETQFTYMDKFESTFEAILKSKEWSSILNECATQNATQGSEFINTNSDALGLPKQEGQQQSVEILLRLIYTAARIGEEKFIRLVFGTSAGRTAFEAYKNKSPLPEDIADAFRHEKIASYFRDITARFSKDDGTSQTQSKVVNWLEIVRAESELQSGPTETNLEELQKDDTSETAYFADTEASSPYSNKEMSDSDDAFKTPCFKDSVGEEDEKTPEKYELFLRKRTCYDEGESASSGPLPKQRRFTLGDDQGPSETILEELQIDDTSETTYFRDTEASSPNSNEEISDSDDAFKTPCFKGNDDSNETKFTTSSDVEDRAISIEENAATSVENKNKDTFLSADNDHGDQEERARVKNENNQTSQKDRDMDYRREREDKSMVLNQQSSPESNSKMKKKKKASKGTENIAQTTSLRQDEEKEGPTSSEANDSEDVSKIRSDFHNRRSMQNSKGDTVNSGWTLNADPFLVANNDENQAETTADEYEMNNEVSQKERDMDDRFGYYERTVLSQQSSSESKSKNKKTKESSKQTGISGQTINRGDEKMTEGPSFSQGQMLVAIDQLAAAVEITPVVDNIGATVTFPGKCGNTVFPTDTIETTNKENEKYLGGSSQKVVPSKTNTFRSILHLNAQTTKQDHDGANTFNQERESKVKHLTESRTGDEGKDSAHVSRCNPRPRGVPGRSISYEKGSVLDAEENRELEFKSLVSAQPSSLPWKIMEKAKKFICACLNADKQGIIYFGVGDSQEKGSKYQHGEIIGLDVEDIRDDINKAFQFVLDDHIKSDAGALQKAGEQNCVNIYFVPVKNQGNRCHRYVIEIEVARDWRFCKDHIYYSQSWTEKRGADKDCTGKKALSDFFNVKDEFDDVAIRTNGASSWVKPHEVERQAKKPLVVKYKDWRRKTKHGANELPEEFSLEDADAKSVVLRERLRELNYKEYSYLLVANKIPAHFRGTAHLSFLQNIPWVAVFDLFDPYSKRDGLHHACNETTDAPRAKIRTLDDFKEETPDISTRGTTWILNNKEMQKGDWIKCSKDCLYRALSAYKRCFPPGRLVCVFLCFSENAVNEMADIMESSFSILGNSASRCVTIISESKAVEEAFIKASKFSLKRELRECSITGIPWNLLKEIVREMVGPSKFEGKGATTELPHFTGFKEVLNKIVHSWDDLEVYYPNPRLPCFAEAIEKDRDAFYKGAQASQINLFHNHSIPRSLEKEVTVKVQRALKSLSKENVDANVHVKTVTISYEPGSGATTLCRRILWSKRMDYRCAVVKAITPSTDYQIEKLQSIGHDEKNMNHSLPVLVLVDNFPESDVRVLTEHLMERQTKCVVLTTISKSTTNAKFEITLGKLNDVETTLVKDILINVTSVDTEKRREAEHVLERERRFIWFGLELFGREYLKIEERLQNHIHSILMASLGDSRREHQTLLDICCFLNKYSDGNIILPHSVLLDSLYERRSWTKQQSPDVQDIHEVFGGLLLEVQNETNGYYGWRPAHSIVSEVVTSRITVEDTAILALEKVFKGKAYVIKFLRHQVFRLFLDRKRISDPVFLEEQAMDDGAVDPDLENEVFGFYGERTRYSPVIVDILEKESNIQGALKVLLTMCEQAKTEHKANAWQQLARFMGYEMRAIRLDTQDDLYKRLHDAIKKENPVQLPVTTTGIDAAHMAVDIAVSLQPSYTYHYTTKGVLYLSQLRDYKPPSLRSLPEAIEICRKALRIFDKALEISRGRNHFSMMGKIQAIISLLEIIKDLPCFHSEDRTFMRYLEKGDPPPEMTEVLSQDDQDYVQSISSTTLDVLNELFGSVKLKQTTSYDENELRSLNNAKIRASDLRRKFYEITGLDKRELSIEEHSMRFSSSTSQELALFQQKVQDILFINDETPYSAWSNLADSDVGLIYQLLKYLCLRGRGSHNDMLICSKACLQLKEKPPVDDLKNIVNIFVEKFPNSEWAHLFHYMIHFPIPNGSLARYTLRTKESIKKCSIIVQEKAGSGFRKSGAEYFLGKGIGLNAIVSSQEFRWLETKWKTKTDFWRGKEPSERLERIQGQKDASRKGIISYHGIQIHFDNTRYPNESKDDLWFYLGFTVAGPYAYDPVDNDTYESLKRRTSLPTTCYASSESPTTSGKSSSFPLNGFVSRRRIRNPPPKIPAVVFSVPGRDDLDILHSRHAQNRDEHNDASDGENGWIVVGGRFNALYACNNDENPKKDSKSSRFQDQRVERKAPKAEEQRGDADGVKAKPDYLKTMVGTRGSRKKNFDLKCESADGKLHHGAFVLGTEKSQECKYHDSRSKREETERCKFAHGWRGDTLQFVCTKCTEKGMFLCREKIEHEEYIWNLGPYYNGRGKIWKDETALR